MENTKKEFYNKWDKTTDFELGVTFNTYKDANKVWEWISQELDKAREEGYKMGFIEGSLKQMELSKLTNKENGEI